MLRPPSSTLFPYTTLFRSWYGPASRCCAPGARPTATSASFPAPGRDARSEEHTSELQSRQYLVCRLLLEKKKNAQQHETFTRPPATNCEATVRRTADNSLD